MNKNVLVIGFLGKERKLGAYWGDGFPLTPREILSPQVLSVIQAIISPPNAGKDLIKRARLALEGKDK